MLDSGGGSSGSRRDGTVTREVGRGGGVMARHRCAGEGRLRGAAAVRGIGPAEAGVEEMEVVAGV